jgi:hypothetical protein
MCTLNMDASNNKRKWILGVLPSGKMVGREEAAIIFWAWRCLYAEVVAARVDNRELSDRRTHYKNTIRMAYTRVKAYGDKWYRWYSLGAALRNQGVLSVPGFLSPLVDVDLFLSSF